MFHDVESVIFCDESKYSIKDNNAEDAVYYFAIIVPKSLIKTVTKEFESLYAAEAIQAPIFHAKKIFKSRHPRLRFMGALTNLLIEFRLYALCFKYDRSKLYEAAKIAFEHFNDGNLIDFNNPEFQALTFFGSLLDAELRSRKRHMVQGKCILFFEANVYGRERTEEMGFGDDEMVVKRVVFLLREKVKLMALPDFVGYIFRLSKISHNDAQIGKAGLESNPMVIYAWTCLIRLKEEGLFHFLDIDDWLQ